MSWCVCSVKAMRSHPYDAEVQAAAARSFARISMADIPVVADVQQPLLHAYRAHRRDGEAQKWTALALALVREGGGSDVEILRILCQVMQD